MSDILKSVGGGVYEIRCVICGETFMMSVGDQMQVLVRDDGNDTAPIHNGCGDSSYIATWIDTGKAIWE